MAIRLAKTAKILSIRNTQFVKKSDNILANMCKKMPIMFKNEHYRHFHILERIMGIEPVTHLRNPLRCNTFQYSIAIFIATFQNIGNINVGISAERNPKTTLKSVVYEFDLKLSSIQTL